MDALMAALVAAALAQLGEKTPRLAALLADRYRAPGTILVAALLALAVNYSLAAVAGAAVAPTLTPNAKQLLLALALGIAAATMPFVSAKSPDRLAGWRLGSFLTGFLGLLIMAFGDATQLVAAALAARSPVPWLAAVGAVLGALAVIAPAVVLGEKAYLAWPLAPLRWGAAAVLAIAAIALALGATGLI